VKLLKQILWLAQMSYSARFYVSMLQKAARHYSSVLFGLAGIAAYPYQSIPGCTYWCSICQHTWGDSLSWNAASSRTKWVWVSRAKDTRAFALRAATGLSSIANSPGTTCKSSCTAHQYITNSTLQTVLYKTSPDKQNKSSGTEASRHRAKQVLQDGREMF